MTPERLAELRASCRCLSHDGMVLLDATEIVADRDELLELVQAADNLAALLAAAESAVLMMSTKNSGQLRAAICRAKGEQP